jgi:hypothetical protein
MKEPAMSYVVQLSSFLLFLCMVALIAGCDAKPPKPKTESALEEQVKTALASQAGVDAERLEIETNAGVVRIKGQLDSNETRQRVQETAKKVPGVTWVQDQTSVAPSAPVPSAK